MKKPIWRSSIKKVLRLPQPVLGTPLSGLCCHRYRKRRLTSTHASCGHWGGGARASFPRSFSTAQSPSVLAVAVAGAGASCPAPRALIRLPLLSFYRRPAGGHRRLLVVVASSRQSVVTTSRSQQAAAVGFLDATRPSSPSP
jgi:hypothetical protein